MPPKSSSVNKPAIRAKSVRLAPGSNPRRSMINPFIRYSRRRWLRTCAAVPALKWGMER